MRIDPKRLAFLLQLSVRKERWIQLEFVNPDELHQLVSELQRCYAILEDFATKGACLPDGRKLGMFYPMADDNPVEDAKDWACKNEQLTDQLDDAQAAFEMQKTLADVYKLERDQARRERNGVAVSLDSAVHLTASLMKDPVDEHQLTPEFARWAKQGRQDETQRKEEGIVEKQPNEEAGTKAAATSTQWNGWSPPGDLHLPPADPTQDGEGT